MHLFIYINNTVVQSIEYNILIFGLSLSLSLPYLGQQMEEKGIEWVCPNCAKKKDEEIKARLNTQNASGKQRIQSDTVSENSKNLTSVNQASFTEETSSLIQSGCDYGEVQYSSNMQCVVCKKEARNSSIYCSDACILAHAQETLTKDKPISGSTTSPKGARSTPFDPALKQKTDARVIVFERKTGKVLTGSLYTSIQNVCIREKEKGTFPFIVIVSLRFRCSDKIKFAYVVKGTSYI